MQQSLIILINRYTMALNETVRIISPSDLRQITAFRGNILAAGEIYFPREIRDLEDSLRAKLYANGMTDFTDFDDSLDVMYYGSYGIKRKQPRDIFKDTPPDAAILTSPISRKDETTHVLTLAHILADAGINDPRVYKVSNLHDTHENTRPIEHPTPMGWIHHSRLADLFGTETGEAVSLLSKVKTENDHAKKPEIMLNIMRSLLKYPYGVLIKLADRLHIMRTLSYLKPHRQMDKAIETLDFYVKLAQKLGLHEWAEEMGSIAVRTLYGKRGYKMLVDRYKKVYPEEVKQRLMGIFQKDNEIFQGLPIEGVRLQVPELLRHHKENGETRDIARHDCFLLSHIHINTKNRPFGFGTYIHEILKRWDRLGAIRTGFGFLDSAIIIPKDADESGIFQYKIRDKFGRTIILEFESDEYRERYAPSLADLYRTKVPKDGSNNDEQGVVEYTDVSETYKQIAAEKLERLQANVRRLDEKKRHTPDIVNEFIANLDTNLLTVQSANEEEFTFPEGATALDFAYAAGPNIGTRARHAIFEYPDGRVIPDLPLSHPLEDGVKVIIVIDERKEHVDSSFIQRFQMVKTQTAKERIAQRIRREMEREMDALRNKTVPRGLHPLIIGHPDAPLLNAVREKGLSVFRIEFTKQLQKRNIWPGKLIMYAPRAEKFKKSGPYITDGVDLRKYITFLEEVGLELIVPNGRRSNYFDQIVREILARQNTMVRIDINVPNIEGVSEAIGKFFHENDVNVEYEETEVEQLLHRRSRMTRVITPEDFSKLGAEEGLQEKLRALFGIPGISIIKIGPLHTFPFIKKD